MRKLGSLVLHQGSARYPFASCRAGCFPQWPGDCILFQNVVDALTQMSCNQQKTQTYLPYPNLTNQIHTLHLPHFRLDFQRAICKNVSFQKDLLPPVFACGSFDTLVKICDRDLPKPSVRQFSKANGLLATGKKGGLSHRNGVTKL